MKKFEITEEQIKELAKGNKKVEKMFPDVFEEKKEVGKWYYLHSDGYQYLYCLKENNMCYGFFRGEWTDENWHTSETFLANSRTATEEEVESALIKEAERRGFKNGVKFNSLYNDGSPHETSIVFDDNILSYDGEDNSLDMNYGYRIFCKGFWGEIIKTKYLTKKQAEEELTKIQNDGYEYEIID